MSLSHLNRVVDRCSIVAWSIIVLVVIGSVFRSSGLAQEIVLKFAPEVGQVYEYDYSVNLDKTTMGKKANERLQARLFVNVLSKEKETFQTRWEFETGSGEPKRTKTDKKARQSKEFDISEQYVFSPEEGQSLFFPNKPVSPGSIWEGKPPFNFGDLCTATPPALKVSYRFVRIEQNRALIEATPVETNLVVPFQVGQLGIRCDTERKITGLRKGTVAEKYLKNGDVLLSINGCPCTSPKELNYCVQRFIEPVRDIGAEMTLGIKRDGKHATVKIPKILGDLGQCRIAILRLSKKAEFDLKSGVVISDIAKARFSINYDIQNPSEMDDYLGTSSDFRDASKYPREYDYEWKLVLRRSK